MVATRANWLATSWLFVTMLIRYAQRKGSHQEDHRQAEQEREASAERNVEDEFPHQYRKDQVKDADGEVGDELAQDQFRAPERG